MQKRLKVLWLCNIMLPQIAVNEGMPATVYGGWVSSLLRKLMERDQIDIAILFPQPGEERMAGQIGNVRYFSEPFDPCAPRESVEAADLFETILRREAPDVIHLFGAEYASALSMAEAAERLDMLDHTTINIQGLAHVITRIMYMALPPEVQLHRTPYEWLRSLGLQDVRKIMEGRAELEKRTLRKAKHVFGRTTWDHACTYNINPALTYHNCPEILREPFYSGKWELSECEPHTLFCVAEHPIKGLPYLLQALPFVIEKYPDVCVRIAGERMKVRKGFRGKISVTVYKSTYDRYIDRVIKKNKLGAHIQFLGSLSTEEMKREYLRANAFVLTSVIENESNTLSEAKMLGVPCVAAYVGGALDRIEHGVDGYQYPSAEPEILAYYICKLFEDPQNAAAMGARAKEKTLALCDPERVTDTVMRVYEELAQGATK